jgi:Na+/H+ antiporter NhaD/arsenite permease-like protein
MDSEPVPRLSSFQRLDVSCAWFMINLGKPKLRLMCIALAFMSIMMMANFPGWQYVYEDDERLDIKPLPSSPVCLMVFALSWVFAMFALVAVHWQSTLEWSQSLQP